MQENKKVVIVGGGLAGLATAIQLEAAGFAPVIVEGSKRLGGVLRTDHVDGFLLDYGFQVLFDGYPTAKKMLDMKALQLCAFEPGSLIWQGGRFGLVHAKKPFQTFFSEHLRLPDLMRLKDLHESLESQGAKPDVSTLVALRAAGFSETAINDFFRPFLGGIFLDRSLSFSARQFAFVWKNLQRSRTTIPAAGIQAIPDQLAARLTKTTWHLGATVVEVTVSAGLATGVKLSDGEELAADAVVIATEPGTAECLLQSAGVEANFGLTYLSSTCFHFESPVKIAKRPILFLMNEPFGLVNEIVPVSVANPQAAPVGKHLVSVTVLGDHGDLVDERNEDQLAKAVLNEVRVPLNKDEVEKWRLIRTDRIKKAQFAQPPGFEKTRPPATTAIPNMVLAGAATTNYSIEGALESGLNAASLVQSLN